MENPWRPIADAPKDRMIDLMYPPPRGRTIDCYWDEVLRCWAQRTPTWDDDGHLLPEDQWDVSTYPYLQPTHYMLPPPPP